MDRDTRNCLPQAGGAAGLAPERALFAPPRSRERGRGDDSTGFLARGSFRPHGTLLRARAAVPE
jgi:hypothetical protein